MDVQYIDPEPSDKHRAEAAEDPESWPHLFEFSNARDLLVSEAPGPQLEIALAVLSDGGGPEFDPAVYTIVAEYDDRLEIMATGEEIPPPTSDGPDCYHIRNRLDLLQSQLAIVRKSIVGAVADLADGMQEVADAFPVNGFPVANDENGGE